MQLVVKNRKPARSGLRLMTSDGDTVNMSNHYRGRSAFLVLSGPSLNELDLSKLNRRGIFTMGVNNSWTVHRPNLWTCVDPPNRFVDVGWKDPGIMKLVPVALRRQRLGVMRSDGTKTDSAFKVHQMPNMLYYRRADKFDHRTFLTDDCVQWGCLEGDKDAISVQGKRSVMLAAMRILHYLGFRRVYLIGCDFKMSADRRYAFDEGRSESAIKHNNTLYDALHARFEALKPHFDQHEFEVFNCSPGSELGVFESMDYADAIELAGGECGGEIRSAGWYTAREKKS